MSFSKDIDKFASESRSMLEAALAKQHVKIKQFLIDFLGDDVSKIEHIEFDNDASKFFNLKAPQDIIDRFKAKGYLRDC